MPCCPVGMSFPGDSESYDSCCDESDSDKEYCGDSDLNVCESGKSCPVKNVSWSCELKEGCAKACESKEDCVKACEEKSCESKEDCVKACEEKQECPVECEQESCETKQKCDEEHKQEKLAEGEPKKARRPVYQDGDGVIDLKNLSSALGPNAEGLTEMMKMFAPMMEGLMGGFNGMSSMAPKPSEQSSEQPKSSAEVKSSSVQEPSSVKIEDE